MECEYVFFYVPIVFNWEKYSNFFSYFRLSHVFQFLRAVIVVYNKTFSRIWNSNIR